MKTSSSLFAAIVLALGVFGSAQAQTYVLESQVLLTGTILTQGPDASVTTVRGGVTITTKRIVTTPFTNREVITEMTKRTLITGTGWGLAYLADDAGHGGIYARKTGTTSVAVPADLLTLPVFGPTISGGMTVTGPSGGTMTGTSDTSFATASVKGIAVSGLANNGVRTATFTIKGVAKQLDTTTTVMSYTGGITDADGSRLAKGVISIGSWKLSNLTSIP